jgi:(1->4)-alpha-D-glucan 1-alpha-D-glucosylmutase
MLKAIREAKRHTSWTEINEAYEQATKSFVAGVLDEETNRVFLRDFSAFQRKIAFFGAFNSLPQTLLKITSPGVPDFYQGSELWDLNLVDPDNRRRVDFTTTQRRLNELAESAGGKRMREFTCDNTGALKLFVIHRALQFRNAHRELMDFGGYASLDTSSEHTCAFARIHKQEHCMVIVPRLLCTLLNAEERDPIGAIWHGKTISIRCANGDVRAPRAWKNIFTAEVIHARDETLRMEEVFASFPLALLTPEI